MYTAYNFTHASFKVGDSDWFPLSAGAIESDTIVVDFDTAAYTMPLDYSITILYDKIRRRVPLLRFFTYKPTIARRKMWRYMERMGL
jgi:hypothetical protein